MEDQATYNYITDPYDDSLGTAYEDSTLSFANSDQLFHSQPTLAAGTTVTGDEIVIFAADEGPPPYLSLLALSSYSTAQTRPLAATYQLNCV